MKKGLQGLMLTLGSLILCFILLELFLALFSPHKLRTRPYHEKYHPVIGWVNKPLKDEGVHYEFARDRFFHVRHNGLGLRGGETTYEKPAGARRILLVGDSYFWGYGVQDEEVISAVLQKALPPPVEVLNGGTTGYGTDQMLLWLKNEGLKFSPDIVVFGFSAANDLDEIASSVSYYSPKPVFTLEMDRVNLKNVPVPRTGETDRKTFGNPRTLLGKVKKFLRYHTHTYQFISGRLNSIKAFRSFMLETGLADEYTTDLGNLPVLRNPPDSLWEIAISLIKESRRITEESGGKFVLLFIPDKEYAPEGRVDDAYEKNTKMSRLLRDFAAKEKFAYFDLLPVVRASSAVGEPLYNQERFDHHWNAAGHRVAAAELLAFLKKEGWL
ncbi:MAG: SGNH/GDSL hydrolase family protein [Nitrospirae bacterium]|nr:SGNH/GDSL hydrolase family protein [Nitrospirota bacterium]